LYAYVGRQLRDAANLGTPVENEGKVISGDLYQR
jgi:hypothetical protein